MILELELQLEVLSATLAFVCFPFARNKVAVVR